MGALSQRSKALLLRQEIHKKTEDHKFPLGQSNLLKESVGPGHHSEAAYWLHKQLVRSHQMRDGLKLAEMD